MARPRFNPLDALGALPFDGAEKPRSAAANAPRASESASSADPYRASSLTVSQAAELIKSTLEHSLPPSLRVIGQVSNFSSPNHWYFSLKDQSAVLGCVAWATTARRLGFVPRDGDEVIATGHVSHFTAQGRTQLYVDDLRPVGAGALELQFRALCDQLRGLGYFDDGRKRPLPVFPRRIAVITSATGAALQDVISTAAQRCRAIGLVIVDVRVQGEGAAGQIARAIRWVDARRDSLRVDAVLVTRGGGSIEDLWAFNERIVAEAVFYCSLPVVAAIGHESDTTIIELVADLRASTPTQAAMRLIPSRQELCRQIDHLATRLGFQLARNVQQQRQRLKAVLAQGAFRDPAVLVQRVCQQFDRRRSDLNRIMSAHIAGQRSRLARLTGQLFQQRPQALLSGRMARAAVATDRLHRAVARRVDQRDRLAGLRDRLGDLALRHHNRLRERLRAMERELAAVDPHGVLKRGYSLTQRRDGELIRSATQVKAGEAIVTRLADGSIDSVVSDEGKPKRLQGQMRVNRSGASPESPPAQFDLFSAQP